MSYLQTDAAINGGNSGGPLVNLRGEVVGINSMTMANAEGISFAIPIDTAKLVAQQLVTNGRVGRPYIGIRMITLTPAIIQQLKARNLKVTSVFAASTDCDAGAKSKATACSRAAFSPAIVSGALCQQRSPSGGSYFAFPGRGSWYQSRRCSHCVS
jgi:S1-C subfamily serine protease